MWWWCLLSCYAFATTETLSDRLCITGGFQQNISPELVLDCDNGGNDPCNGGIPLDTLQFLAQEGNAGAPLPTAYGQASSPDVPSSTLGRLTSFLDFACVGSLWLLSCSHPLSILAGCYPYTAGSCPEGGTFQSPGCPAFQCPNPLTCADGSTPFTYQGSTALQAASVNGDVTDIQNEIMTNGPVTGTPLVDDSPAAEGRDLIVGPVCFVLRSGDVDVCVVPNLLRRLARGARCVPGHLRPLFLRFPGTHGDRRDHQLLCESVSLCVRACVYDISLGERA